MGKTDQDHDVELAVQQFIDHMAGLNLTLTDEEIEQKRAEITAAAQGTLVPREAGEFESFEEAALAAEQDPDTLVLDDYQKLDDKNSLVGVPFWINRWWFTEGEMGDFAVLRVLASRPVMTVSGPATKLVVTDGSTGIFSQLRGITRKTGKAGDMMVRNGLRVSQYTADTESGPKRAETFYLT